MTPKNSETTENLNSNEIRIHILPERRHSSCALSQNDSAYEVLEVARTPSSDPVYPLTFWSGKTRKQFEDQLA